MNPQAGLSESISYGGRGVLGYAFTLGAAGDPDIFASLSPDQQTWVLNALVTLNASIQKSSGTSCPTWVAPSMNTTASPTPAVNCFQTWWNNAIATPKGPGKVLRTDGAIDEDTLCALLTVAALHPTDFTTPFPDPTKQHCQPIPSGTPGATPGAVTPATGGAVTAPKKLSTGAMVGIGLGGAALVGGLIYAGTHHKPKGRRKSR